uniref:FTH domain-containing protein n=1 Tax=Caenorhabditis tropicalis TaxID=1561998 RepID=A0A1I7UDZ6_9PELO
MPIAYEWISEYGKEEKDQLLHVFVYANAIFFQLVKHFEIKYRKIEENGKGSTRVECDKLNKDTTIEGDYIQVFCDDFKEFLINRKCALTSFKLLGHQSITGTTQIHECLEFALKSRSDKLEVIGIRFEIFNTKQQIDILQIINPNDVMHFYYNSDDIGEVSTFLRNWNQGCRLEVTFQRLYFSTADFMCVKEMLNYPSTFVRINVTCIINNEWSKERLMIFFKPFRLYSAVFRWREISFNLENQSEEMNLAEQIDCLSLQYTRLLEVFGNRLLMKVILEGAEWFYIQNLRKVSRDIRACIDTLKPDPHIIHYSITQNGLDEFDIIIQPRNGEKKCIRYRNREFLQYKEDWNVDSFVYCGNQLFERVVNDFKVNIEHQKSRINELILDGDAKLTELIGNVLKSRGTPLNVKKLELKGTNEKDILKILPYLNSVEHILINSDATVRLYLNDVPKLEQWKNAHALEVKNCTILNLIPELNLHNFKFIDIRVNSINTDDVIYLKEIATQSVVSFSIHYNNSEIDASLYTTLPPYEEPDFKCIWYFPMSISVKFLKIELDEPEETLRFFHIDRKDVPEDFLNALN